MYTILSMSSSSSLAHSWDVGVPAAAPLEVETCDNMLTGSTMNAEAVPIARTEARQAVTIELSINMSILRLSNLVDVDRRK